MITRREALKATFLTAAAVTCTSPFDLRAQAPAAAPPGPFQLPPLGYAFDALEPYIDAQTMQIHHDKHHAAYVSILNAAVAAAPAAIKQKSVDELVKNLDAMPEAIRLAVRNQGGGHYNHSLFWQLLKKDGGKPSGELAKAIDKSFGSFDGFQKKFAEAATKVFGSGWAWLTVDSAHQLAVVSTPNQDSPLSAGATPLLGIDVWEHAYYLKYQNKRADYIAAFANVIHWDFVSDRYAKAKA